MKNLGASPGADGPRVLHKKPSDVPDSLLDAAAELEEPGLAAAFAELRAPVPRGRHSNGGGPETPKQGEFLEYFLDFRTSVW